MLQSPCPSVHTFVTDISVSTGRNDFIFDIWLWHPVCRSTYYERVGVFLARRSLQHLVFIDFREEETFLFRKIFRFRFGNEEKIICSISIWNTSRITYDFIEGH